MTLSLDGFVSDQQGDVSRLYPNFASLQDTELLHESITTTGAVVMGRHSYEMGQGDYTGYEYQVPIFVVTHQQAWEEPKGQNERLKIEFVTDGLESAVRKAKTASRDKDVTIVGGASIIQQCLQAGLLDELHLGIMPVFLHAGLRFFEHLEGTSIQFEKIRIIESPDGRTDIIYRVVKVSVKGD